MADKKTPSAEAKFTIACLQSHFSSFTDPFDVMLITMAADTLFSKGWTISELYAFFSNFEEVNPDKDENFAIVAMQRIEQRVEKRLQEVENVS